MSKKKIAIITMHQVKNYGSVLQTYATQCYFEGLGFEVEFIDFRRLWETKKGYWFAIPDKSVKGFLREIMYFPSKIKQYYIFNDFLKRRIHLSKHTYTKLSDFTKHTVNADVYCTGSDQVWNSGWNRGVINEYYLSFVDRTLTFKKISFAASFGRTDISDNEIEIITPFLKQYDVITVREKSSVDLLRNRFGIEAKLILDPTLQMIGKLWHGICKSERIIKEEYVLLIQLNRNHSFDKVAIEFSNKKHYKLIRLCLRVDQIVLPGKHIIIPEVEDYIRLIRDAEYVLTDSFHAVSFCMNLNKQFYCYYPDKYSERLKSILSIMDLENRVLNNRREEKIEEIIDYRIVNMKLNELRKEADSIFMLLD